MSKPRVPTKCSDIEWRKQSNVFYTGGTAEIIHFSGPVLRDLRHTWQQASSTVR
jgi:hypothetical protein